MSKIKDLEILKKKVDDLEKEILANLIKELKKETDLDFELTLADEDLKVLRADDYDYIYIEMNSDFSEPRIADICSPEDFKHEEGIEKVLDDIENL